MPMLSMRSLSRGSATCVASNDLEVHNATPGATCKFDTLGRRALIKKAKGNGWSSQLN